MQIKKSKIKRENAEEIMSVRLMEFLNPSKGFSELTVRHKKPFMSTLNENVLIEFLYKYFPALF